MSYLHTLPIDMIKIDRSFIKDYPDKDGGILVKMITEMARTLGMKVLVEGVENETQQAFLLKTVCDFVQGYLYCKPISLHEMMRMQ